MSSVDDDKKERRNDGKIPLKNSTNHQKYLGFRLDKEYYGLELLSVREIIRLLDITPIPRSPECIRGIINLRGKIIPVVDLRRMFRLEPKSDSEVSCIIVVDLGAVETGIIVDRVAQVVAFEDNEIEDSPSLGSRGDTGYIMGIGKKDEKVYLLIDISKVMEDENFSEIIENVQNSAKKEQIAQKSTKSAA